MKRLAEAIFGIIVYAYFIPLPIAVLYFNYQYANQHGFVKWLFFGEIIATLKATIWPIIILLNYT